MRTDLATVLLSLTLAGCPSRTPPAAEAPSPAKEEAEEDAEAPAGVDESQDAAAGGPLMPGDLGGPAPEAGGAECIEQCMHASMAEARSPDAIRADCEASCGTGGTTPIRTGADLAMLVGKRVEATGTVVEADYPTMDTTGWAVALGGPDGAKVWVSTDGPPTGWEKTLGQQVRVEGTLGQGPTGSGERIRIPFLDKPAEPIRIGEPK